MIWRGLRQLQLIFDLHLQNQLFESDIFRLCGHFVFLPIKDKCTFYFNFWRQKNGNDFCLSKQIVLYGGWDVGSNTVMYQIIQCPQICVSIPSLCVDIMQSWNRSAYFADISQFDSSVIRWIFETALDCIRELCTVYIRKQICHF